MLHAFSLMMTD